MKSDVATAAAKKIPGVHNTEKYPVVTAGKVTPNSFGEVISADGIAGVFRCDSGYNNLLLSAVYSKLLPSEEVMPCNLLIYLGALKTNHSNALKQLW